MTTHCTKCGGKISVGISTKWPNAKVCATCARCAIEKFIEPDGGDMTQKTAKDIAAKYCRAHNVLLREREAGGGCYNCHGLEQDILSYSSSLQTRLREADSLMVLLMDCQKELGKSDGSWASELWERIEKVVTSRENVYLTRLREVEAERDRLGKCNAALINQGIAEENQSLRSQLATLESTNQQLRESEKKLSDAYLRIRALVNAWDTSYGGDNRFEVTEEKIKDKIEENYQLTLANQQLKAELNDFVQSNHLLKEEVRFVLQEVDRLKVENERLREERSIALDVKSKDGLSASEWLLRTGKAEAEVSRLTTTNLELVESTDKAHRKADEWKRDYDDAMKLVNTLRGENLELVERERRYREALESGQEIVFEGCSHMALDKDLVEQALR